LRITGGRMRGRRLLAPKGRDIRPTSDRVREAVFNLLGQDLDGCRVLDLFAGTGALGIESLSRGAEWAVLVDRSPEALRLIARNLERLKLDREAEVIRHDLRRGLPPRGSIRMRDLDVVFLDPPYGRDLAPPILNALGSWKALGPEGLVVAETATHETLIEQEVGLRLVTKRRYGDTSIHLFAWDRGSRSAGRPELRIHENT